MALRSLCDDLKNNVFIDITPELVDDFETLLRLSDEIATFAGEYDYSKDLKFNGFRSIIKMLDKFSTVCRESLLNLSNHNSVLEVTKLLIDMTTKLIFTHEQGKSSNNNMDKTIELSLHKLNEFKQSRPIAQKRLTQYWSHFSLFWMDPDCRKVASMYTYFLACLCQLPISLSCLVFKEYQGALLAKLGWEGNAFFPINLGNMANNSFLSGLNMVRGVFNRVSVQTVLVPRQKDWIVPENDEKIVHNSYRTSQNLSNKPVSIRIIRYNGHEPSGSVVLHGQGGAFIIDARPLHENYLFNWVTQLEGAVIVNIEYSRSVKYPVALQEFLDVYLWLNTEEARKELGFNTKNIVLAGDSAGGYLVFVLSVILRDMQLASPSFTKFPSALVLFYPALSLLNGHSASFYMAMLDAFVTPSLMFSIISLYAAGVVYESECYELDTDFPRKLDPYKKPTSFQLFYNTWIRKEKTWFDCEPAQAKKRFAKICNKLVRPYMCPVETYDLNLLKNLPLFIVTGEFDPLLDSTINAAKKWKGITSIDILEDLHHAFLLNSTGERAINGSKICLRRLQQALGINFP